MPKKRVRVTEGLYVNVSNHFFYSDFGIRDSRELRYSGRRFVMSDTPGTGFFERESESHSYHQFVRRQLAKQRKRYWRLLLGKEPSFTREVAACNKALESCDDGLRRQILESYSNALAVARSAERMERVIRGIKDKMGHKSNKFMVRVMSHYKNKLRQLEDDMRSVIWMVKEHCSEETYQAYLAVADAFTRVASCRRIWIHDRDDVRNPFKQVFFDMGVFDFMRVECYLPMMRDSRNGMTYYILPDAVLAARSSTDFDVVPLKGLTMVCQELAIEEPSESMMGHLGDAASMLKIPEFDLDYYFNHVRPVVEFVHAVDRLKETL